MKVQTFAKLAIRSFFRMSPERTYYVGCFTAEEMGFPSFFATFGEDENGNTSELRHLVARRTATGFIAIPIAISGDPQFRSDAKIVAMLETRDIDPITLKPLVTIDE